MAQHVPVSLIRQLCYTPTVRLEKPARMPVDREPLATVVHPPSGFTGTLHARPHYEHRRNLRMDKSGPLPKDDYRFYYGTYTDPTTALCRWCGSVTKSKLERRTHGKGTCKRRLTDLYAYLLAEKHCVQCAAFTGDNHWGLPLCKNICKAEFQFQKSVFFNGYVDRIKQKLREEALTK